MFRDRYHGGEVLAEQLRSFHGCPGVIVLGLPRGGIPVAYEIAKRLEAPLDVFIVRKLGVPGHGELAIGAIASGKVRVLNDDVVRSLAGAEEIIEEVTRREENELARQERLYRGDRAAPDLNERIVILVDDGLATGATMRAAIAALRLRGVGKLVVAVPVGAPETCREIGREVDQAICASIPPHFHAVGQFYRDFSQVTDEEVRRLLRAAADNLSPDSAD